MMRFVTVAVFVLGAASLAVVPPKPASPVVTATPAAPAHTDSDTRLPVPMNPMMANHQKENMRDHLAAVQAIVTALAANDFPAIESAAGRMGYTEQMGRMCEMMGAGAPGFSKVAINFHHTADTIGVAAKKKDSKAVLEALQNTLATCTSCHATYRQVVEEK